MEILQDVKFSVQLKKVTFCQYELNIDKKYMLLSFPQLLQLRNKIKELTHPVKLDTIINKENFVLLFVADKKHLLYLDIPQLLDLKDEINYFFSSFKSVSI